MANVQKCTVISKYNWITETEQVEGQWPETQHLDDQEWKITPAPGAKNVFIS